MRRLPPTFSAVPPRQRQRGIMLLLMMLGLILVTTGIMLTTTNNSASAKTDPSETAEALAEAKQALVAYALTISSANPTAPNGFLPGYLPCPDTNGDGKSDTGCGLKGYTVIGRLPWSTLDMAPVKDGAGECLWYAVSGNYKNASSKKVITTTPSGMLQIEGGSGNILVGGAAMAIAVVFAPGKPVSGQSRSGTAGNNAACVVGNNVAGNYLESYGGINNASGTKASAGGGQAGSVSIPTLLNSVFVQHAPVKTDGLETFNDTLIAVKPIDYEAVHDRMRQHVAERVRKCLNQYAALHGNLPWAPPLDDSAPPGYTDSSSDRFGRIPASPLTNTESVLGSGTEAWPGDPAAPTRLCFDYGGTNTPNYGWWWWNEWREQVFYAVDADFAPTGSATAPIALDVNGSLAKFSVIVAGDPLAGQLRDDKFQKGTISNYLESPTQTDPTEAWDVPPNNQTFTAGTHGASYNDWVCSASQCPP